MALSIDWINPKRGNNGKGGRGVSTGVKLTHTQYKDKAGNDVHQMQVRLGPDVMKACRFVVGDNVRFGVVLVSGAQCIAIKRDVSGKGFTLSNSKGKQAHGSTSDYGTIKMKAQGLPEFDVPLEACSFTDDGVLLVPTKVGENDLA
jgi:hypothetical protein